jgi:uncharacterized protein (UPF0332 family)
MPYVEELLATAEKLLAEIDGRKPSRSDCNRAVSTAYYAVFHFICAKVADRVSGVTDGTELRHKEWTEVFRSVTHSNLLKALISLTKSRPDAGGNNEFVLKTFNKIQAAREDADYNSLRTFEILESRQLVLEARVLCQIAFESPHEDDSDGDLTYFIRCLFSIKPRT